MSLLGSSLTLYLLIGLGVAFAIYLVDVSAAPAERWFRVASAVPFWPIYVPILLGSRSGNSHCRQASATRPIDEMAAGIAQVEVELETALGSLDGWAEDVLARERDRLSELRSAWTAQAERIREMDRLLALPDPEIPATRFSAASSTTGTMERLLQSQQARRRNMERFRRLRQRAHDDLMATLGWVRELVSMIHLAKFTGAPASRAEELVAQIAAAVEGLADVTWREDSFVSVADNTLVPE